MLFEQQRIKKMTYKVSNHYSYKFKFNIDKLPAIQKDRLPKSLTVTGLLFGAAFIALAVFDLISAFFGGKEQKYDFDIPTAMPINFSAQEIMVQRYTFDGILLVLGTVIVVLAVMAMRRYKEIYFDGENIKIDFKPFWGEKQTTVEHLKNYLGVLLKIEYYQLGLINKNRYIIELYHKEKNKRIPLYLTTKSKNLHKIWGEYAQKLKLPALFMTDHGLISRHYQEFNQTLKEMSVKWHLKTLYRDGEEAPKSVKCKTKTNKVIVKERRWFFDAYTFLALFGLIVLGALAVYAGLNYQTVLQYMGMASFIVLSVVILAIIMYSIIVIFSKDVLIITPQKVILGHNILFLRMDAEMVSKDNVEGVDIGYNPTMDRYYLNITSDEHNLIFGRNMPLEDLRWVRGFVIREIVK